MKIISLKNIKSFYNQTEIDIKPLTILTGKNSSGKSNFTLGLKILHSVLSRIAEDGIFKNEEDDTLIIDIDKGTCNNVKTLLSKMGQRNYLEFSFDQPFYENLITYEFIIRLKPINTFQLALEKIQIFRKINNSEFTRFKIEKISKTISIHTLFANLFWEEFDGEINKEKQVELFVKNIKENKIKSSEVNKLIFERAFKYIENNNKNDYHLKKYKLEKCKSLVSDFKSKKISLEKLSFEISSVLVCNPSDIDFIFSKYQLRFMEDLERATLVISENILNGASIKSLKKDHDIHVKKNKYYLNKERSFTDMMNKNLSNRKPKIIFIPKTSTKNTITNELLKKNNSAQLIRGSFCDFTTIFNDLIIFNKTNLIINDQHKSSSYDVTKELLENVMRKHYEINEDKFIDVKKNSDLFHYDYSSEDIYNLIHRELRKDPYEYEVINSDFSKYRELLDDYKNLKKDTEIKKWVADVLSLDHFYNYTITLVPEIKSFKYIEVLFRIDDSALKNKITWDYGVNNYYNFNNYGFYPFRINYKERALLKNWEHHAELHKDFKQIKSLIDLLIDNPKIEPQELYVILESKGWNIESEYLDKNLSKLLNGVKKVIEFDFINDIYDKLKVDLIASKIRPYLKLFLETVTSIDPSIYFNDSKFDNKYISKFLFDETFFEKKNYVSFSHLNFPAFYKSENEIFSLSFKELKNVLDNYGIINIKAKTHLIKSVSNDYNLFSSVKLDVVNGYIPHVLGNFNSTIEMIGYDNFKDFSQVQPIDNFSKKTFKDQTEKGKIGNCVICNSDGHYENCKNFEFHMNSIISNKDVFSWKYSILEEHQLSCFKEQNMLSEVELLKRIGPRVEGNYLIFKNGKTKDEKVLATESLKIYYDLELYDLTKSFQRKWLTKFNIAEKISINPNNNSDYLIFKNNQLFTEDELGLAAKKITSLIFNLTNFIKTEDYSNNEKIIFVEEPESNLHPDFQSLLVEMFVDFVFISNMKIVIESHSEYFIRKLQYMIGSSKLNSESVGINYFEKNNKGESKVQKINIKSNGMLDHPFGPGFLDEASNLTIDLLSIKNNI